MNTFKMSHLHSELSSSLYLYSEETLFAVLERAMAMLRTETDSVHRETLVGYRG